MSREKNLFFAWWNFCTFEIFFSLHDERWTRSLHFHFSPVGLSEGSYGAAFRSLEGPVRKRASWKFIRLLRMDLQCVFNRVKVGERSDDKVILNRIESIIENAAKAVIMKFAILY